VNSAQSERQDSVCTAAAALEDLMPRTCSSSSSEDAEVAAINIGCEEPPPFICGQQSTFTDSNSNGPDSPTNDLDLDSIELN